MQRLVGESRRHRPRVRDERLAPGQLRRRRRRRPRRDPEPHSGHGSGHRHLRCSSSPERRIGGATSAARNVVGNNDEGIHVFDSSDSSVVQGNYVGLGTDGNTGEGNTGTGLNGIGIDVVDSNNVQVGGPTAPEGNVASGNDQYGIHVKGAIGTTIQGNRVGTNAAGTLARPNGGDGIRVEDDSTQSSTTKIGGSAANGIGVAPGNLVSGNAGGGGIHVLTDGTGTAIQGNIVGLNAAGTTAVANGHEGILVENGDALVGGTTATAAQRHVGERRLGDPAPRRVGAPQSRATTRARTSAGRLRWRTASTGSA